MSLSFLAIRFGIAGIHRWDVFAWIIVAYFLGLGIAAHSFDQLPGMGSSYVKYLMPKELLLLGLAASIADLIGIYWMLGMGISGDMRSYRKEIESFAEYGLGCGKAMQIADDMVDLRKVIEGKKSGVPGSEHLLLGYTNTGINSILDKEIARSRMIISSINVLYEYREMLLNVPSGIADMMLGEEYLLK